MQIVCFCYALKCGTTQGNTRLLALKEREILALKEREKT